MSQTETQTDSDATVPKFDEGTHIVNVENEVIWCIESIDRNTVTVTDNQKYSDESEHTVTEINEALESDDLLVVDDSDLTQIKGVGPATAPKIVAQTGIESADAMVKAYLTDVEASEAIRDAVPNLSYLHEYICSVGLCDRDIGIDRDGDRAVQSLLFARQIENIKPRTSQLSCKDSLTTSTMGNYDGNELVAKHVKNDDMALVDSACVMMLLNDMETFKEMFEWGDTIDDFTSVESVTEYDGEAAHTFSVGDGETHIGTDYVEQANKFFDIDITDVESNDHVVLAHTEGEYPIIIHARNMVMAIAPRIVG